jgi:acetate kinase
MNPASPRILTINGGSSSIKFALFEAGESLRRALDGSIERIGLPDATFAVKGSENFSRPLAVPNHTVAVNVLMDWLEERSERDALTAVGHRVVHGGPKYGASLAAMGWDSLESKLKKNETQRMRT